MRSLVHYIPIVTSVFAIWFGIVLTQRYREKGGLHHLWWAIGVFAYAAGTITESLTTLIGWHEPLFRAWYRQSRPTGLIVPSMNAHTTSTIPHTLTVLYG